MGVKPGVFGANTDTIVGISAQPDVNGFWTVMCNLGNDCETHEINDTGFVVSTSIQQKGGSDVTNNVIDLGAMKVLTSPDVSVGFTCTYATTVTLTSDDFTLIDVTVSGSQVGFGDLDNAFTLTAGEVGDKIVLGNDITVKAEWPLSLSGIYPHFLSCDVSTAGNQVISIIKAGCISKTLKVKTPIGDKNYVQFNYRTFAVENQESATQSIHCEVKICPGTTNCAKDVSCPSSGTDLLYDFQ